MMVMVSGRPSASISRATGSYAIAGLVVGVQAVSGALALAVSVGEEPETVEAIGMFLAAND